MTTKIVNSENPLEHWSDIQSIQGEIVLDLGCGWLHQPHQSTPEYFVNRGAAKIIGVDVSCAEIEQLKQRYPDHEFICTPITSTQHLVDILHKYRPTVIKMDIEGHEAHLKDLTEEQFSSVKEVAIEYHDANCKKIVTNKLQQLGFEIFATNQFGFYCLDPNIMGIMHAKRSI